MAEALVEHDYKAQELDELTIRKGDIITNISFKPGGWWEGNLVNGKRGMFPENFVKLIKTEDGVVPTPSSGRRCKVLFPYLPEKEDELELQVGDIIDVITEVEEGWWKGSLRNKTGVFPSNFVAEITDGKPEREAALRKPKLSRDESGKSSKGMNSGSFNSDNPTTNKPDNSPDLPTLPPKPAKEYCKVIYKYVASNVDELTLQPGDIITIVTKEVQDPGWWKGELKGKVGVFPDNFVSMITLEEATKTELKTKVSNRSSMAISKSATTSSISETANLNSLSRKFSDSSKSSEEKIPPSVSKKPVLPPPPNKKPTTSSISSAKSIDSSQSGQTASVAKVVSSSTTTIKHGSTIITESSTVNTSSSSGKWSIVESSDTADGLVSSKQSYSLRNEKGGASESVSGVNISSLEPGSELNLDMVGRSSKKLVHPTATRAKAPKRRPPSGIYTTKEGLKNGADADDEEEEESEGVLLVNGDTENHRETESLRETEKPANPGPPWVEELRRLQAHQQQQGKTRVMIGMTSSTSERSVSGMLTTSEQTVTPSGLTTSTSERSVSGISAAEKTVSERLVSERSENQPPAASPESKPSSHLVMLRQQPTRQDHRPQSMVSFRPVTSPPSSDSSITVSLRQWNELNDKVLSLETSFETQLGALTRAVRDLTGMLEEERQRRLVMQQELEKLSELVTQV